MSEGLVANVMVKPHAPYQMKVAVAKPNKIWVVELISGDIYESKVLDKGDIVWIGMHGFYRSDFRKALDYNKVLIFEAPHQTSKSFMVARTKDELHNKLKRHFKEVRS